MVASSMSGRRMGRLIGKEKSELLNTVDAIAERMRSSTYDSEIAGQLLVLNL
jgi:hypothetical protein